jgi:spermidine synthase
MYDLFFRPPVDAYTSYYKESDYYTRKVKKALSADGKTGLKALVLDNLLHSYVNLNDPLHIEYPYEKIYSEVFHWKFGKGSAFQSLTIGGGGYTFPRYMEAFYPNSGIDVVEIDPGVSRVAYTHLGLPVSTRIHSYNEDGRWFVMNCKSRYDVIFIDAYNDLSMPYHITTKEFAKMLKDVMNPDGILLTNIIDSFPKGAFLPSYVRTLQEVFGEGNVHLISINPNFEGFRINTFVVMTGRGKVDIKDFESYVRSRFGDKAASFVMPDGVKDAFMKKSYSVVLRDDYAPVDNLIAPIFEARFGYNRKTR